MLDDEGKIITEEKEIKSPMYKPVTVFDVSQTEGKPLPELVESLTGDVQNYEVFMEALRRSAPVPISFEKMAENMDGCFSVDNQRIVLREGMSEVQTVCAAVYAGNLDRGGDTQDRLDALYETFNIRRPEDFHGHSLSVSDIVALKQNGVVSCHYVEPQGFRELPGFLQPENYLKNAEMAMEDDYGMIDGVINNGPKQTVAELEEQAKSGNPISLMELAQAVQRENEEKRRAQQPTRQEMPGKKPSILAKLKAQPTADTTFLKSAPKRSAEREL